MKPYPEVVVTGVGVVTPIGVGADSFWDSLVAGRSGVSVRTGFEDVQLPHRIAASVSDFVGKEHIKPRKAMKIMCAPVQFGCGAAAMAFAQANFGEGVLAQERLGTVFGTETFFADPAEVADVFQKCTVDSEYQHERWGEFALREIQPLWMLKYLPNMAASHISIAMDARGPSNSICQGEASGLLSLIEGADLIQRGAADVVIVGGTGSRMSLVSTLYRGVNLLSKNVNKPEQASCPFAQDRDGMVVGEGAGAIVLESKQFAENRGANILCDVGGWSRGYHRLDSDGFSADLQYHLAAATDRAGLKADQIDLVNANAMGAVIGDAQEAQAIAGALGTTPVVAHKGAFGNLGPGTSMVELIASILTIQKQHVPPTLNCQTIAADCPINVLNRDSPALTKINNVLKSSYSATGQIATVVIQK